MAGVHTSTVSRALAGSPLVEKGMREKILRIARTQGYTVNSTARSLRLKRTENISVVFPLGHEVAQPLTDPFFIQMIGHLADEITQRGYGLFLQKVVPPMEDWLNDLIASKRADGVIVIGQSTEHWALEAVAANYKPLVVWGGRIGQQSYCTVGSNNAAGARIATEHLLSVGRRSIVFFGDTHVPELRLRYQGYCQALAHGPRGTAPKRSIPTHMTAEQAFETMMGVLATGEKFDGVVCGTDVIAMSAIRAIAASGKRVPKDVSVVGYDDLMLAAYTNPPLTTVRQNIAEGAHHLVDLLFRRMEGMATKSLTMAPELVIRDSSGT